MKTIQLILFLIVACLLLGYSLWVRILGLYLDPSIDEVWSMLIATNSRHWLDIFYNKSDNNHFLITLYLYLTQNNQSWLIARLPSLFCSLAIPIVAWRALLDRPVSEKILSVILCACAYPLVYYSFEARGYTPLILLVLTGHYFHKKFWICKTPQYALLFFVSIILGTLAHSTYLVFSVSHLVSDLLYDRNGKKLFFQLHFLPILFYACFYLSVLSELHIAGGQHGEYWQVLLNTYTLALGGSPLTASRTFGILKIITGCIGFVLMLFIAHKTSQTNKHEGYFYLLLFWITPIIAILSRLPTIVLFERYFLIQMTFFWLLLPRLLRTDLQHTTSKQFVLITIYTLLCSLHLFQGTRTIIKGRGGFADIISFIQAHSGKTLTYIRTDEVQRTNILASYLVARASNSNLKVISYNESAHIEPEWHIRSAEYRDDPFDANLLIMNERYELVLTSDFYGLSGEKWALYKKI